MYPYIQNNTYKYTLPPHETNTFKRKKSDLFCSHFETGIGDDKNTDASLKF